MIILAKHSTHIRKKKEEENNNMLLLGRGVRFKGGKEMYISKIKTELYKIGNDHDMEERLRRELKSLPSGVNREDLLLSDLQIMPSKVEYGRVVEVFIIGMFIKKEEL